MSRTRKMIEASYDSGNKSGRARESHLVRIGRYEDLPFQLSMRGAHRSWRGSTTYNCAYLHRFLEANCGRVWDDVWSEFCAKNDVRTETGRQARETLLFYVGPRRWESYWRTFGVTADGILFKRVSRFSKRNPRWKKNEVIDTVPIDDTSEYRKLDGIWYQVFYAPVPAPRWFPGYTSTITGITYPAREYTAYYYDVVLGEVGVSSHQGYYAWKKVQLSRHKLKELKVRNDANLSAV